MKHSGFERVAWHVRAAQVDLSVGDIFLGVLSCGRRLRSEKLEASVLRVCSWKKKGWFVSRGSGWTCGSVRRVYGQGMRF